MLLVAVWLTRSPMIEQLAWRCCRAALRTALAEPKLIGLNSVRHGMLHKFR